MSGELLAISLTMAQVSHAVKYITLIKNKFPQLPIVLGGPYVTGVRENIFNDFPEADYAVVKEGEYAIIDLVEHLQGKKPVENVRNLIYRDNGDIKANPVERIRDLDSLPMLDYTLVMDIMDRYTAPYPSIASPSIAIMCARGCPYNCTFCSSPTSWDRHLVHRSTDSVIDEILFLKKAINVKEIFFQDDTLNARPQWFSDLCDKIIANKLNETIFFKCPFRVNKNLLTEELLIKAKQANFWMIFYGVENGNQKMLEMMNKDVTITEIKRAFKLTRKVGLASYAAFMIGNYGETHKTVDDSISLMKKVMPDYGGFAIAVPFPGSKLYDIAVNNSLLTFGKVKDYKLGECILRTNDLTELEIVELHEKANSEFWKMKKTFRYKFANRKNEYTNVRENFFYINDIKASGFYDKEWWGCIVYRTKKEVELDILNTEGLNLICLEILADYPDIDIKPVEITFYTNDVKTTNIIEAGNWDIVKLPVKGDNNKTVKVHWRVNRTWVPKNYKINDDTRELGVVVKNIWFE